MPWCVSVPINLPGYAHITSGYVSSHLDVCVPLVCLKRGKDLEASAEDCPADRNSCTGVLSLSWPACQRVVVASVVAPVVFSGDKGHTTVRFADAFSSMTRLPLGELEMWSS